MSRLRKPISKTIYIYIYYIYIYCFCSLKWGAIISGTTVANSGNSVQFMSPWKANFPRQLPCTSHDRRQAENLQLEEAADRPPPADWVGPKQLETAAPVQARRCEVWISPKAPGPTVCFMYLIVLLISSSISLRLRWVFHRFFFSNP